MTYEECINLRNSLSDKEKEPIDPESRYVIVVTPELTEDFSNYYKKEFKNLLWDTELSGEDLDHVALKYSTNGGYLLRRLTLSVHMGGNLIEKIFFGHKPT